MRWRTGRRALAAFFAAWFLVVEEEPAALHACAMHDGPAHAASSRSDRAPRAALDDATAHHAGARPAEPARHDNTGRHSRCCTCLAPCCAASPVALIGATGALVPVESPRKTEHLVRRNSYRPSEPEHARPPSLGPPAPQIG